MKKYLFLVLIVLASMEVFALKPTTEWQWSVMVRNAVENNGLSHAFLWIPPNCKHIRGVVVAQHNMEEISILENPIFRKTLSEIGFAEIWCVPPFDHLFRFNQGADVAFNGMMDDFAEQSGYTELKYVPIVPIGHSAAASWPYYFAAWNPGRTLAAISVSGQWPYFRNTQFAPDIWGDKTIDFVPCLETMGEYEAAATWSSEGLKERQQHPLMPLSMLACPAEGHFAASDKKAAYLSLYIQKAIEYRYPKEETVGEPLKLKPIDPSRTGWLAEKWRLGKGPAAEAAPVGHYKGNPAEAFWFFDEEMVKATQEYQKAFRYQKPQLVGYVQEGQMIPQRNSHLQVHPAFMPLEDGITFQLSGAFYDTVPAVSSRLTDWTKRSVGSPLGHGSEPIAIDRISGPFKKVNANTFMVSFDRSYNTKDKRMELVFKATHPGDKDFKPAVQQASMIIPVKNREGTEQHLIFSKIPDQKEGIKSIRMIASTNSGMPVQYYILEGPAEIQGNRIIFTKIPPRSKFPVKVTVVAWQYGRSLSPKIKTAEPVEQSFFLTK